MSSRCKTASTFARGALVDGVVEASSCSRPPARTAWPSQALFSSPGALTAVHHVQWSSKSRSQIDFLLLPAKCLNCCVEVRALPFLVCNSGHIAVKMSSMLPGTPAVPAQPPPGPSRNQVGHAAGNRAKQKPIGWKCKDLSSPRSSVLDNDEVKTLDEFNCLVKDCCVAASGSTPKLVFHGSFVDTYLAELLRMRRVTPDRSIGQELSKAIFEYHRHRSAEMQEERISKMLQSECKQGWAKRHWPNRTLELARSP